MPRNAGKSKSARTGLDSKSSSDLLLRPEKGLHYIRFDAGLDLQLEEPYGNN